MAGFMQPNGKGRGRYRPLAEINVTPLVDVMLVLLIIFMVTAPLMTSGVPVDLPKVSAKPVNSDSEPLTVSVNAEGKIYLQDQVLELSELVAKLQAIAKDNNDRRIFVRGDKGVAYGTHHAGDGHHHPGRLHQGGAAGRAAGPRRRAAGARRRGQAGNAARRRPHIRSGIAGQGRRTAFRTALSPVLS